MVCIRGIDSLYRTMTREKSSLCTYSSSTLYKANSEQSTIYSLYEGLEVYIIYGRDKLPIQCIHLRGACKV